MLQGPRLIVWASLAASILAVLVVVPAAWQRQADAEARILADAAPMPGLIVPPAEPQPEAQDIAESAPEDDRVIPGGQLAQADPIRPPAEPAPHGPRGRRHVGDQVHGADAVRLRPRAPHAHAARWAGREVGVLGRGRQ